MTDIVNILTTIPSTDGNFISALKRATVDELDEAIEFIETNPIGQIARKYAILSEKRRRKKDAEQEPKKTAQMDMFQMNGFANVAESDIPEIFTNSNNGGNKEDKNETISDQDECIPMGTASLEEIIQGIPKPTEEEIMEAKKENTSATEETSLEEDLKKADVSKEKYEDSVDTSFVDFALSIGATDKTTYDQAAEVLRREMTMFSDDENLFVLHGLLKAAKEDEALAAGILRKGKSYRKAFSYFSKKSQEYGIKLESCYWLTKEQALPLAIEYYKIDEEEVARKKATEEAERKKKSEESKKKTCKRASKKKANVVSNKSTSANTNSSSEVTAEKELNEIPDMSVPEESSEEKKDDQKNDFLSKFSNFSFNDNGQLSFI